MAVKVNILVTGANGQLGSDLRALSEKYDTWNFFFTDVDTLDITQTEAVNSFVSKNQINYIVNCAAYTAVDKAEGEPEKAYLLNATAVGILKDAANANNTRLIHVSTDYVFDGEKNTPYAEDEKVNPQSVYGRTKQAGEVEAIKADQHIIVRTAWLYSSVGHNFVKTMLKYGTERGLLKVVFDQAGSPTYSGDLALAILQIIAHCENSGSCPSGIYHFSNEGVCSWFDFAKEIINFASIDCKVIPILTKDYPSPVKRPAYSVFDKTKIKTVFNLEIPHWRDSLKVCLDKIKD
jgi:dTDP-4-dehydrorhamnose reductase